MGFLDGLAGGLGNAIKEGLTTYQAAKKDQDAQKRFLMQDERDNELLALKKREEERSIQKMGSDEVGGKNKLILDAADKGQRFDFGEGGLIENLRTDKGLLAAKSAKERDPLAQSLAQARLDEMNDKKKQRELAKNIPGLIRKGDVGLDEDEVKKLRTASVSTRTINDKFNELLASIEKHGTEMFGQEAQNQQRLARDIQLDLKNPDFKQLGVLAGPDLALLETLVQDPTTLGAALRGNKSQIRGLKDMQARLNKGYQNRAIQSGYDLEGAPEAAQQKDSDAEKYAQMHNLPYEQAKAIVDQRRGANATAKR